MDASALSMKGWECSDHEKALTKHASIHDNCCSIVWYGMVCGVVWYAVVWYVMCGMVWCVVVV